MTFDRYLAAAFTRFLLLYWKTEYRIGIHTGMRYSRLSELRDLIRENEMQLQLMEGI